MRLTRLFGPLLWMAAGGAVVYYWNPRSPHRESVPSPSTRVLTFDSRPEGLYCREPDRLAKAPVLRVVDGDTVVILWEDTPTPLRYYGVNTTERGVACYEEATARNRALVGGSVRLAFDERVRDVHERLLAYVFTEEGLSVDAQLVAEGLGKAWKRDGRLKETIVELEDRARGSKTGCLWSGEVPPDPVKPRRKRGKRR